MTESIEDRLRAHFAEQAARDDLGEPDPEVAVTRALAAPRPTEQGRGRHGRPGRSRRLAVVGGLAAACLLAVVAVVAADRHHPGSVHMSNEPTTTARPTTSAPEPSTTVESTPAPPSTSLPPVAPATDAVTVGRDGVLGWWDGRGWVDPTPDSSTPLRGGERFQVLRLGRPATTATGSAPRLDGCGAGDAYLVDLGSAFDDPGVAVAVTGVAGVQPRPAAVLDPATPGYREAAQAVLQTLGITDPGPTVAQVVRADIDGDGSDEALVVAERISDPQNLIAAGGDYSVLFLRRLVNGSVQTTVVEQSLAAGSEAGNPFIERFRVGPVADLNGDGRMEVVVDSSYYEGSSTVAYELAATGTLESVMAAGCGS